MKLTITMFTILSTSMSMNAQFEINNKFYLSSELNIGNHLGIDLNFNVITKKNHSFKVGYTGNLTLILFHLRGFIHGTTKKTNQLALLSILK